MKGFAQKSPIKEIKKSNDAKPNQIIQKKGKKRAHKEIGEIEKRPKKANK